MSESLSDMRTKVFSAEVLYPDEAVVRVTRSDVAALRAGAARNRRRRMRLCAHPDVGAPLHEMLIAMARDVYVRPHKHPNKSESFHVIEGEADVVLFDDCGAVERVIRLGDYASGRCFYYRVSEPWYHTILVHSDVLVVHETTDGPFRPSDTRFAPWAPAEEDAAAAAEYRRRLLHGLQPPAGGTEATTPEAPGAAAAAAAAVKA